MSAESSASAKAAKGPSDSAKPNAGNSQNKTSSPSSIGLRQSPVTPLAPLEFLQNQRRGSITDPSLHAASSNINIHTLSSGTNNIPPALRHPESVAPAQSRPSTAYRFGDASGQSNENTLPNIRRLLRSPSTEGDSPVERAQDLSGSERSPTAASARVPRDSKNSDRMNLDIQPNHFQQSHDSAPQDRPSSEHFDFKGRRSSIAGTKRKMSSDRAMAGLGNGDGDTQLVGPGVPSALDAETPASKRRNSTIDTQRIAQLSLYDRRNSVDARAGGGPQWWGNERRDSAPSMLSNTPMTGYSTPPSGFSGDSPHGRPPSSIATFAWPVNTQADQSQTQASGPPPPGQNEANMSSAPHYDPLAMMPPVSFPPDRRMSAPAISPENMSLPPSSGPTRALRSRSRPPSRVRARDQSALTNTAQSPGPPSANVIQEDAGASSSQHSPQLKESGSAPYSRSPELRVSHKLAERKRRKEMKDLFDELRDQLPADRGMKASKWEILSKAIDFIVTLKQSHQDMSREIDMLRHELDGVRQGLPPPPFGPGGPGPMYGHGPPPGLPYPPPPGPSGPPVPPLPPPQLQQTLSRPGSSHNHSYPSGTGPVPPLTAQNGTATPTSVAKTDTPS